ncbi:MAG: hypothetical protein PHC60_08840 [Heliobacteriaceae bacterium]|nr:hypothetical protein [Heliobacteriaceae bacterium]MDD4588479.1 hypothetical protein [Heliobacteriaceae bacterium]
MKKARSVALALIAALVLTGAGYAAWSENIPVHGTVNTGELDWCLNGVMSSYDVTTDYACDPGFTNIRPLNKNVGHTILTPEDSDGDGDHEKLVVTVVNAYPSYYNTVYFSLVNNGTIPLKIGMPLIQNPSEVDVRCDNDQPFTILEPGRHTSRAFEFRINDSALENTTYTFSLYFPAVQWNASL